jgi:F-type H+-transporting ATPase subunit beta
MLGMAELPLEDQQVVRRARRLERFLTQPLFTTESFTGQPGCSVGLEDTLTGCEAILAGEFDTVEERIFRKDSPHRQDPAACLPIAKKV